MVGQGRKKKDSDAELDVELGPIKVHLRNAKWAILLISIGLMFAIIIYAHSWYRRDQRQGMIRSIAERIIKGKPLTDKDAESIESLTPEEKEKLMRLLSGDIGGVPKPPEEVPMKITAEVDDGSRFILEQRPAPGTPVTIRRDGKTVEIRKGEPPSE